MKKQWQGILLYVVIFVVIIAVMAFSGSGTGGTVTETAASGYNYNQLVEDLSGDNIKMINIQREADVDNYGTASVIFSDGKSAKVVIPSISTFMIQCTKRVRTQEYRRLQKQYQIAVYL